MKTLLSVLLLIAFATPALAEHPVNLEQRVRNLERQMNRLSQRVVELEYANGGGSGGNYPMPAFEANCMLIDSGYGKTFLGTGFTKIDAEFNARKACNTAVNATYCTGSNALLRCDDTSTRSSIRSVCLVTDSGYGKVFRGEGLTQVAAEAKARQSCQQSVNATYCSGSNVKAQCDSQF